MTHENGNTQYMPSITVHLGYGADIVPNLNKPQPVVFPVGSGSEVGWFVQYRVDGINLKSFSQFPPTYFL